MRPSKFLGFPVPFPVHPLPPMLLAAGVIELVAGIMITVGLFTRLAAFIASGEMAVGYFIMHFPKSFVAAREHGRRRGPVLLHLPLYRRRRAGRRGASTEARLRNAPILGDFLALGEARLVPFACTEDLARACRRPARRPRSCCRAARSRNALGPAGGNRRSRRARSVPGGPHSRSGARRPRGCPVANGSRGQARLTSSPQRASTSS